MPQRRTTDSEGYISGDQLQRGRQVLTEHEVDAFLEFLFSNVARRPERVALRETAGVVRYLRNMALFGVPSNIVKKGAHAIGEFQRREPEEIRKKRAKLEKLALTIWAVLLQSGDIKLASKPTVLGFLRNHKDFYLRFEDVGLLMEFVRDLEFLSHFEDAFQAPFMMSANLTYTSRGNPHLQDDVTERIYAAYWALKREGISGVRPRIAEALTRFLPTTTKRRRGSKQTWTYVDVSERIKQHEKRLRAEYRWPKLQMKKMTQQRGHSRADWWILSFRWDMETERRQLDMSSEQAAAPSL